MQPLGAVYRLFTEGRAFPAREITLPTTFDRPIPNSPVQSPALALKWVFGILIPFLLGPLENRLPSILFYSVINDLTEESTVTMGYLTRR